MSSSGPDAQSMFRGRGQGTSAEGTSTNISTAAAHVTPPHRGGSGARVEELGRTNHIQLPDAARALSSPVPRVNRLATSTSRITESAGESAGESTGQSTGAPELVGGFLGLTDEVDAFGFAHIPPDPTMASGPNHLMGLINSDIGIFDKADTLLQRLDATNWYQPVLPGKLGDPQQTLLGTVFDPKVIYDHFANRWVMVWLASDRTTKSWILVSASNDDDPNGGWCSWALPGDQNGSEPAGNWSDYQGLGFDNQAVYVVPNQFGFNGSFDYAKIRILPKDALYDNTCPAMTWTDLWDLRYPPDPTRPRGVYNLHREAGGHLRHAWGRIFCG